MRFNIGQIWSNEKTLSEKPKNQSCSLKKSAIDGKNRESAVISNQPILEAGRRTSGRFLRSCTKANDEPVTALMNVGAVKSRRKMTKNLTVSNSDAASSKEPKINYPVRENENIDVAVSTYYYNLRMLNLVCSTEINVNLCYSECSEC